MKTLTILIILAACLFACRAQEDALVEVVPIEEPAAPQSAFDLVSRLVAGEREGIFAPSHIFHSELDPTARSFAEFAGFLREHGIVFTPSSEQQPTISYGSPSSSEVVVHVQGHLSVASTGQVWAGESVSFVRAAGGQVVEFRAWSSDPLGLAEALRPRTPAAALRALVHYWSHGFAAAFTKVQRPDALAHFHGFDQFWPGLAGSLKLGTLEGVQTLTALLGSDHLSNFQLQVISEHDNQVFGQVTLDRKNSLTKAKDQLGSHYVVLQTDDEGKVTFISLYLDTALIPEEAETKTARKHEAEVRRKEEKQQSKQQKKQQKAAAAAQAAQALVE